MARAAFFVLVGSAFMAHWLVTDPTFDQTDAQAAWSNVLAFSGVLLLLAIAIRAFASVVGGRAAHRAALVAGTGAAFASAANVVEDGLGQDWAFFAFVASTATHLVGLLALAAVLAFGRSGTDRLVSVVPIGVVASIVAYVAVGGPLMLATWLVAAVIAAVARPRGVSAALPTTL